MALIYSPSSTIPENLIDLFGRLRVSQPSIIIKLDQSDACLNRVISEGVVFGLDTTRTYNAVQSCTTLTVNEDTAALRRFKTKVCGSYQSGKSLLYLTTFSFSSANNNAIYTINLKSTANTLVSVERSDWNIDKLDGTGISGISLDFSKSHIFFIALEWLGVGDAVCGFIENRELYPCHIFKHSNILSNTYMRTANLFPNFEIESTFNYLYKRVGYFDDADGIYLQQSIPKNNVSTNLDRRLIVICASLINEGNLDRLSCNYSINRSLNDTYNTGTALANRAIILFRLNPDKINSRVTVSSIDIQLNTDCKFLIHVCRAVTFTNTVTPSWTDLPDSSIQYDDDPATTTVTVNNVSTASVFSYAGVGLKNQTSESKQLINLSSVDCLGTDYKYDPEIWAVVIQCSVANAIVDYLVVRFTEEL